MWKRLTLLLCLIASIASAASVQWDASVVDAEHGAFDFSQVSALCGMANGLGLLSFIRDLTLNTFRLNSRPLVIALTFVPPLLIGLIYPDIFLKALDIVGGVGIVVLFGILPTLIVVLDKSRNPAPRLICAAAFLFALTILGMELLKETGYLHIAPWADGGMVP